MRDTIYTKLLSITACFIVLSTVNIHAKVNPSFIDIESTKRYRIVSAKYGEGSIGIGALHNSDIILKYIVSDSLITEDCYWYIEKNDELFLMRNAKTGQYLSYTPERDYTTYVNLKIEETPTKYSRWNLDVEKGHFIFVYRESADYKMSVDNSCMVKTGANYINDPSTYFYLIDEDGNKVTIPNSTPFSSYINNLSFDGQRLIFENRKEFYMFPLPAQYLSGGTYTPNITFDAADDAEYKIVEAGGDIATFKNACNTDSFNLILLRNDIKVAQAVVAFSPIPIIEVTTTLPKDKEKVYREGKIHILNQSTPDSIGVEQELDGFFRYRGATTLNYPKRSFNIKFKDEEGEDLDTTFFNIRSKDKWILDAMSIDRIKMRNRICFDIWNEYSKMPYETEFEGRNGTKGVFVEMILNGEYNGIYCFTDRIDRKLLDLKKYKMSVDSVVTIRGVLYKSNLWDNTGITNSQLNPNAKMDSVEWNNWELQYPDKYYGEEAWNPLLNLYNVCSGNELINDSEYYFYEENVIDFHLLVIAMNLIDNGNKNLFLSNKNITKENPFVFTPWDMDTSLGGYYDGRYFGGTYDETDIASLRIHKNEPFATLWNNNVNNYRNNMAKRWNELRNGALSIDSVESKLMRYAELFTKCGAWSREYSRWELEEKYGCPTVEDVKAEVESIMEWYKRRIQEVDRYMDENTSVEKVTEELEESSPAYLLNGVKAEKQNNGIVGIIIKNGKKYFIRK